MVHPRPFKPTIHLTNLPKKGPRQVDKGIITRNTDCPMRPPQTAWVGSAGSGVLEKKRKQINIER